MLRAVAVRRAFLIFVLLFLYLPPFFVFVYSFSGSSSALLLDGWSLKWYQKIFSDPVLMEALYNTLLLAASNSFVATLFGTLLAVALEKHFQKNKHLERFIFLPLVIPEIILAIGLLIFVSKFLRPAASGLGMNVGSFPIILAGHVAFSISYVVTVVRARLSALDPNLEEAASDLGATPNEAFLRVTLPLLTPAILSSAIVTFTLSLDDFYISYFSTAGGSGFKTIPLFLYALQGRSGMSPEINALSTLLMFTSFLLLTIAFVTGKDIWKFKGESL